MQNKNIKANQLKENVIYTDKDLQKYIEEIGHIDENMCNSARNKWDNIGKPLRSLGRLEEMVIQLAGITGNLNPTVDKKAVIIFCADNGVVSEGVTQTGQEVTAVVSTNFTKGIATINSFARVLGADVFPVDVGINKDMSSVKGIINRKVSMGTKDILKDQAMTRSECIQAIIAGIEIVHTLKDKGYNMFITGEMGIGNTTTSSAILSVLEDIPVEKVTGKGAGLTKNGINHKIEVINTAIKVNAPNKNDVIDVMAKLGGFDICAIAGAFLGGAIYHVPVIIDGFISAVSANCAIHLSKVCSDYMCASHVSAEPAGQMALNAIGKIAYINAGMCLGEGTGAVLLAQLFDYALSAYNETADFDKADFGRYKLLD